MIYLAIVLIAWLLLFFAGDLWWPGTLLLFGPRWLFFLPLPFLVLHAIWQNRRMLIPLACSALIIFVPLLDLRFPFSGISGRKDTVLRVMTCNVDYNSFDTSRFIPVLKNSAADIVALQECQPNMTKKIPGNWHIVQHGELVVISRFPIKEVNSLKARHPPHTNT